MQFGDTAQRASARAELNEWASRSREHQAYLQKLEAADRALDRNLSGLQMRYVRASDVAAKPEPVRAIPWRRSLQTSLLALAVAASALWAINPALSRQEVSSEIGQQRTVYLDDGSEVLLNTNTAGRFVNRLRSREWTLESGEALFSVTHSPWRPFRVSAGTTDIRDLGTRFSVHRLDDDRVSVAVLEGSVEVTRVGNPASVRLDASQALKVDGDTITRVDPSSFDDLVSWKDQRFQFNGTPLSEVVRDLQRYRSKPIVLADPRAGEPRITGSFSSADPDRLLDMLPHVAPVVVSRRQDGTVVIASRR
ncbi:FecR family protein [Paraburkholderia caballeronis]|uniref:FecR family protein n=1 Tax=Paraburkholderia caballeronis TaxID=416943 RepID=UPI0010D02880|nr:FecR domain-containing protein [Paraburkholderia caballeronis]TDV39156.1 FecR family protein [Paraburkholderia caballeronis]